MDAATSKIQSPFSHMFPANYYPSPDETDKITLFCDDTQKKIQDVEIEIEKAQAFLNGLIEDRDNLRHVLQSHQSLLTPIRHLPTEIIQKIFCFCLPTTSERLSRSRMSSLSTKVAPLQLTRVCSSWRRITLHTPMLWTFLSLSPSRRDNPEEFLDDAQREYVMNLWVTRAATLPVSFRIFLEECWETLVGRHILKSLLLYQEKWNELYITAPSKSFKVWTTGALNLCSLKTFHVGNCKLHRGDSDGSVPQDLSFLQHAPNLCSLTIRGLFDPSQLPKQKLKEFFYESSNGGLLTHTMSIPEILSFIRDCVSLESLRINGNLRYGGGMQVNERVHLAFLQKFSITTTYADIIYGNMETPVLQELEVANILVPDPAPIRMGVLQTPTSPVGLGAFISQCSSSLTILKLNGISGLDTLAEILGLSPNLSHLSLINWKGDALSIYYLSLLTSSLYEHQLVPKLENLTIMPCSYSAHNRESTIIIEFLKMRCSAVRSTGLAKLRSLHLGISSSDTFTDPIVQALITEGVNINIFHTSPTERMDHCKEALAAFAEVEQWGLPYT